MKKLFTLVLCMALVGSAIIPARAEEPVHATLPEVMTGYVVDNQGNTTEVIGELVNTVVPYSANGEYAATYAYDVSMTSTADSPDSGFSSHVYLTVYYKLRNGQNYLLTKVSGYWDIEDYRVTVTKSTLDYVCGANGGVTGVSVSNHFTVTTGFTNFTEDNGTYAQVAARLHLTYKMGTSRTWSFTLNNNVYG